MSKQCEELELIFKYEQPRKYFDFECTQDYMYPNTMKEAIQAITGKPIYNDLFDYMEEIPIDASPYKLEDELIKILSFKNEIMEIKIGKLLIKYNVINDKIKSISLESEV